MIKPFSQYLTEDVAKEVVFTFGRFNPPTVAHEKLLEYTAELAKGKCYRVYSSRSADPKNNPLNLQEKVKYMRKMFPRHARSIMADGEFSNVLQVCAKLYDQGFTTVTFVAESTKADELKSLLTAYNGKTTLEGTFYNFRNGVRVIAFESAQTEAELKMRAAASANDLELFSKNLPSFFTEKTDMFNAVRSGMGLKESRNFRKHIQLESVSARREAYVNGELFAVGDEVVIKESQEVGKIMQRGSNYLVVGMHDGRKIRKWLDGVELLEKRVDDIEEIESTMVVEHDTSKPGIPVSKLRTLQK